MKDEWASLEFEVRPYKETGTFLVAGVDEIVTLLDDHIVKTQTMRGSPYILPIESECKVTHVLHVKIWWWALAVWDNAFQCGDNRSFLPFPTRT